MEETSSSLLPEKPEVTRQHGDLPRLSRAQRKSSTRHSGQREDVGHSRRYDVGEGEEHNFACFGRR
jgi:hypothetical protein